MGAPSKCQGKTLSGTPGTAATSAPPVADGPAPNSQVNCAAPPSVPRWQQWEGRCGGPQVGAERRSGQLSCPSSGSRHPSSGWCEDAPWRPLHGGLTRLPAKASGALAPHPLLSRSLLSPQESPCTLSQSRLCPAFSIHVGSLTTPCDTDSPALPFVTSPAAPRATWDSHRQTLGKDLGRSPSREPRRDVSQSP